MMKMLKQLVSYTTYVVVTSLIVISIFLYQKKTHHTTQPIPITQQLYSCAVYRVIDGDSVISLCDELSDKPLSVRLLHIDAPELSQIPWGEQSKATLKHLLKQNKDKVNILFTGKDVYNRYLGELFIGNKQLVNQLMVEQGRATVYPRYHPPKKYLFAMQKAKQQGLGIWQTEGLHQNPQRYRRLAK